MASIGVRSEKLYLDFTYKGKRCREQTLLADTSANRRKLEQLKAKIEAEIQLGELSYRRYFPSSPNADYFDALVQTDDGLQCTPSVSDYADQWLATISPTLRANGLATLLFTQNVGYS